MASYTTKTLSAGEEVISINKLSKWSYVYSYVNSASLGAVIGVPAAYIFSAPTGWFLFAGSVLGLGTLLAASTWYSRWTEECAVTSKKVVRKSGLIGRSTDELMLSKVEGVDVHQSWLDRLLDTGSIKVTGPGEQVVRFVGIDNPIGVKNQIQHRI